MTDYKKVYQAQPVPFSSVKYMRLTRQTLMIIKVFSSCIFGDELNYPLS